MKLNLKSKATAAFLAVASAVPAFAQEQQNDFDLSAAGEAAGSIAAGLKGLITGSVLPAILVVVGASLTIWGIFLVVRWIRKGAK